MKTKSLRSLVCALVVSCPTIGCSTMITFADGLTSPVRPGGVGINQYYAGLGVVMPNLRFHLGTHPGNVPFNFTDNWGAVIDFGVFGSSTGIVQFTSPAYSVQLDAFAQSAFDLNGAEPFSWSITAFDSSNQQIGFLSESFGFDFAGSNPENSDPYPLARLSLSLQSSIPISRIEIMSDRKIGIDTLQFESAGSPSAVPEALIPGRFLYWECWASAESKDESLKKRASADSIPAKNAGPAADAVLRMQKSRDATSLCPAPSRFHRSHCQSASVSAARRTASATTDSI
jgi:hypothetical protein